jgi:hypothetical protein
MDCERLDFWSDASGEAKIKFKKENLKFMGFIEAPDMFT